MWKLEKHTAKQENEYFKLVFQAITDEIKLINADSKKPPYTKGKKTWNPPAAIDRVLGMWFRSKSNVEKLILANPDDLNKIDFEDIKKRHPNVAWGDIQRILNYDSFTKKHYKIKLAAKLAEIKNVRSCPYCNRAYTMLVPVQKTYIMRADFDHFLTKSKHPLFALSLYNLIPSCLNCNRTIKHSAKFEPDTHLHPYVDNSERDNWRFDYRMLSVDKYILEIDTSGCKDVRVEKTIKDLKLDDIYQKSHSDYELKDLIKLNSSHGKTYINDLVNKVMKDSGLSEQEVYLYLFGLEIDSRNDLNRILNKMMRDIITKLKQITP